MGAVVSFARRFPFRVVDITGGAPELVPDLPFFIEGLAPLVPRLMLRTNLSALNGAAKESLLALCIAHRIVLVASFPSTNTSQGDAQRGAGATETGIAVLKTLNAAGYGVEGTGLELDLVVNPVGAFLPVSQESAERKFRQDLPRKWGISFNHLYTFANVPLGRFREWLLRTGNYERYTKTLTEGFNSAAVERLMCRTLLSVSWDGYLYDCDFNLAVGRPTGDRTIHVSGLRELPPPGSPIAVGDYCYACAAGSGFT
jgi:radical SAM/Cys-rich protein